MAKAAYVGTAASYKIGPHLFKRAEAGEDPVEVEVSDEIAKLLKLNEDFTVDGKGGRPKPVAGEEDQGNRVPAGGFKSRDDARAFAKRYLSEAQVAELDFNRSTPEIQRRIEAFMAGGELAPQETVGEVLPTGGKGKGKGAGKTVAV